MSTVVAPVITITISMGMGGMLDGLSIDGATAARNFKLPAMYVRIPQPDQAEEVRRAFIDAERVARRVMDFTELLDGQTTTRMPIFVPGQMTPESLSAGFQRLWRAINRLWDRIEQLTDNTVVVRGGVPAFTRHRIPVPNANDNESMRIGFTKLNRMFSDLRDSILYIQEAI